MHTKHTKLFEILGKCLIVLVVIALIELTFRTIYGSSLTDTRVFGAVQWVNCGPAQEEAVSFFTSLELGTDKAEIREEFEAKGYERLTWMENTHHLERESFLPGTVEIRTPFCLFDHTFFVYLEFDGSDVLQAAKIRTIDSLNEKPETAPPDLGESLTRW